MIFAPSPGELLFASLIFVILPLTWLGGTIYILSRKTEAAPLRFLVWTAAFVLFYVGLVLTIQVTAKYYGAYTLTILVVDSRRTPVPNVLVNYNTFANSQCTWIGRYSPGIKASCLTDKSGTVVIHTYHGHSVDADFQYEGFPTASLFLMAAGFHFPHQLQSMYNLTVFPPHDATLQDGNWEIPPEKTITLEVTLIPESEGSEGHGVHTHF